MYKKFILAAALLVSAASTAFAQAPAGPAPVVVIMVVEVGATPTATVPKLIELVKRANTLSKSEGANGGKARIFGSTFGGAANQFAIVIEYPSLTAYAASETAHNQSADWQKINTDATAAGLKLVTRELSTEVKY